MRGRIIDRLRDVPARQAIDVAALERALAEIVPDDRLAEVPAVVDALVREGLITRVGAGVRLT